MSETIRLFIAVPLPDPVKRELEKRCLTLRQELPFQKWVHPDDMHITLQFLGETPSGKADRIREELGRLAAETEPMRLAIEGLGTFGKPSAPSILWAGVRGDVPQLAALQKRVEAAMEPLGFAAEGRAYSPHVTLARRYSGASAFSRQAMPAWAGDALAWTAGDIVLYRSHLTRKPMYENIGSFRLLAQVSTAH
ncbi:RNA 2',3'-cyclic phosphodiesterase [Paenibacillus hamazuiensis]|uniref:RNA 2',3'-cyclic phosphodiesterase n=1 Tax=Paenibacillus hamazuiensis TaxID=2936508 RepID=UPI00200E13AF